MALTKAQRGEKVDEELVKKALSRFTQALDIDERNVYATIGIGNCLILLGKHDDAIQIYKVVNETFSNTELAMINLARVHMLGGRRPDAIPIYKKYIEKYAKKEELVELELAAAYCQEGMYEEALSVLKRTLQRFPSNPIIKYNIAICLKLQAKDLFRTKIRKVSQTQDAIRRIKVAIGYLEELRRMNVNLIFTGMKGQVEEQKEIVRMIEVIMKKADDQLLYCKDILSSSEDYLDNDLKVEEEFNKQKKEQDRILREQALAESVVIARRTVTKEEEEEINKRLAELTEKLQTERIERSAKKKGRKKKEEDDVDMKINAIADEDEEEEFNYELEKMEEPEEQMPEAQEEKVVKKKRLHKTGDEE
jgi:tetratricopeptide (TPR) repeat protein